MTKEDIKARLNLDFTITELEILKSKPQSTVGEMSKADKIIFDNEIANYLSDFFISNYHGNKIPRVFDDVLIEWRRHDGLFRYYVKFQEEKKGYVFIDVFHGWDYLGKVIYLNVDINYIESDDTVYGKIISPKINNPKYVSKNVQYFCEKAIMIFMMAYIYVEANKNVKDIYMENTVYSENMNVESEKKTT